MKQQSKKLKKEQHQNHQTQKKQYPNINKSNLDQLPNIQTILSILPEERQKRIGPYFEQVKPFLTQYLQKKVGSRVSQLMYKWGSNSIKTAIYQDIIKHWKQLIKSSYALHIIAKVSRQFQFPGLVDDFVLLQNNKEGAQVLQNYLTHNPQTQIAKKLKQKIMSLSEKAKEGDLKSQQTLDNMAIKSIEKQYYFFGLSKLILRLRLSAMFQEQKLKALQKLIQNAPNLVRDQQGIRLFIEVVNNSSSKQKKALVKLYKGNINQIVNANNISYVSVIKLITQIDDTVLINKGIIQQIIQLIPSILTCKKVFSLIFSLFSPKNNNFNILGKYQHGSHVSNCKKPQEQRKKQLRQNLYKPLIQFLKNTDNLSTLCKDPIQSKLIVGIYKSMEEDHFKDYKPFLSQIAQFFLAATKEAIKNNDIQKSLIADNNASKIIKGILNIQDDFIDFYCDQMSKILMKNCQSVLKTKSSFVLLSIVQKGGRDHLLKEFKKMGINFSQCIGGQHYLKLINKK